MKKLTIVLLALAMVFNLVACAAPTAQGTATEAAPAAVEAEEPILVGIVTDMGIDEAEWLQNLVAGLDAYMAENSGLDVKVVEATDVAEFEPKVRALADANYNIIITMFSDMAEATTTVANDYPDIIFGSLDGTIADIANYKNIQEFGLNRTETGFLAGVAAAASSTTGTVGIVAGADEPVINGIVAGWQQGLVWANPDIVDYVAYANSFTDPTIGKELGLSLVDRGCDVIGGAAGGTGVGTAQAAAERGIYYVAWDIHYPEVFTAEQRELGSAVNWFDKMVLAFIDEAVSGNFRAGERVEYGMTEGVCNFEYPENAIISEDAKAMVQKALDEIIAGNIEISAEPLHK